VTPRSSSRPPRRLEVEFSPDKGPEIEVVLSQGDEKRSYTAVVDSGASTSAFPLEVAVALGMHRDELDRDPRGAYGLVPGDSAIPTYRADRFRITAQVMADIDGYNAELFGEPVVLKPLFLDGTDRFILGRADFFRAFAVSFPNSDPRLLVLEY
jgi:Aspartyl protease